jgi:hypothetical protein
MLPTCQIEEETMLRQTITDGLDILTFGMYRGKTIDWVIENNPDYMLWLNEKGIAKFPKCLLDEADESARYLEPEEAYMFPDLGDK